jgi:Domain of unknown function (DUF5615)
MPLKYLLDENVSPSLIKAIQQHNAIGMYPLDVMRVGDPPNLPKGSKDPDILLWAERDGRILVSLDRSTLPGHLANHLLAGHHSPGVLLIRKRVSIGQIIANLVGAAYRTNPARWRDTISYIP